MTLDMVIGETSEIESTDKGKIQDIVQKVKDLNGRLSDIKKEQVFQRVSNYTHEVLPRLESEGVRVAFWKSLTNFLSFIGTRSRVP